MSLHRLSAGAGYRYLIRHTACGDAQRDAGTPLTAYYTTSGYPPGRWAGTGLAGLGGDGKQLEAGSVVTEEQMAALFGSGRDPLTGVPLGRAYPTFASVEQRIAARIAALPNDLDENARASAVAEIQRAEQERTSPVAVAGFDLTFTVPKSASVLGAMCLHVGVSQAKEAQQRIDSSSHLLPQMDPAAQSGGKGRRQSRRDTQRDRHGTAHVSWTASTAELR
jgi:TrwC relaxase